MQLKQRFVLPVILMMVALSAVSAFHLAWSDGSRAWHGALLASAALPLYLTWFLVRRGAARTSPRLIPVQVITVLGVVLAAHSVVDPSLSGPAPGPLPLAIALIGLLSLEWYVFVYSTYGREKSGAIRVGKPLPELAFETLDGRRVTTRDFVGSKTILVFFRGNWCPLCTAQLSEVRTRADRLSAASVQVKFVSNQSPQRSRELAAKLDLPDHYEILHDRDLRAAKALGIEDTGGTPPGLPDYPMDTVMATVVALDAKGCVTFDDETDSYRVRPHPDVFLPGLEA